MSQLVSGPNGASAVAYGDRSDAELLGGSHAAGESSAADGSSSVADERAGTSVLIIDDEATLRESCMSVLRVDGYDVTAIARGEEARETLRRRSFDIVLCDLYMSQVHGMELLATCLESNPEALVIMMTGNPSVSSSIEALRAGAWDYLPKPFSAPQLQTLIGRAGHTVAVARQSRSMQSELTRRHGHSEKVDLLGASPAFRRTIELARRVARTDASVFITGESGTGKEMIAQFIHHNSRRASRSLVAINCAALPEALLESEMFGHIKGSFTGAVRDREGLLEAAHGGTMFLDELTEMSPAIQAKLLRVLQDGAVRRVGSSAVDAIVNVRFIAATNRDPIEAAIAGDLRRDLFYRLRVVPIHMPALRDRPEDIPLLASHFLTRFWAQHQERGAPMPKLTQAAIEELRSRPWTGNVRELQNVIEHAVVLAEPGIDLGPEDIPAIEGDTLAGGQPRGPVFLPAEQYHEARERLIAEFERDYLVWLMRQSGGNMSKAARMAGFDRTTLYRLMEKHDLTRQAEPEELAAR
jgi:DNA-binding NtrC family response regulator